MRRVWLCRQVRCGALGTARGTWSSGCPRFRCAVRQGAFWGFCRVGCRFTRCGFRGVAGGCTGKIGHPCDVTPRLRGEGSAICRCGCRPRVYPLQSGGGMAIVAYACFGLTLFVGGSFPRGRHIVVVRLHKLTAGCGGQPLGLLLGAGQACGGGRDDVAGRRVASGDAQYCEFYPAGDVCPIPASAAVFAGDGDITVASYGVLVAAMLLVRGQPALGVWLRYARSSPIRSDYEDVSSDDSGGR